MSRGDRAAISALALVVFVSLALPPRAGATATATAAPSPPAGAVALVWPAGGRMLSAPLVVGGSVLGDGSLEMIGDTITSTIATFDKAPPELSLRLFTMVPNSGGGFSAILRFRVPVILLHSWRGHLVRQTMTVVVTPPSGAAQAVQLQPDGTAMSGTWVSGQFSPSTRGQAVIAGNVVVFGIPASFGAASDWTVQAIVKVQANEPLHTNRPATGYAAGTSVVPIGMLTTTNGGSAKWGVADAITALTSTTAGSAGVSGLRPTSVRVEGTGKGRVAVVTLDNSPQHVSSSANPHLNLDLAPPGFANLDHPFRITWLPNGDQPVTSAQVSLDTIVVGDVPVTVSGPEVRFALGAYVPRSSVASPPTPSLDIIRYRVTVPLGSDEAVRSADGVYGQPFNLGSADLNVDRGRVTITPSSGKAIAQGRIDSSGRFTALTATDCYTGSVDQFGNVVIYRTSTIVAPATFGRPDRQVYLTQYAIGPDGDLTIADPGPIYPQTQDKTSLKAENARFERPPSPTPDEEGILPHTPPPDNEDASFSSSHGGAQTGGAQGGNPDWPNTPTVASGTAGSSTAFAVRVSGGIVPGGRPNDVTTPWVLPATQAGSPSSSQPVFGGAATTSTGGSVAPVIAVVAAVGLIGAGSVVVMRRRRTSRTR